MRDFMDYIFLALHSVTNVFMFGMSPIKVWLLIGALIFVCIIFFFFRNKKSSSVTKGFRRAFMVALFISYAFGLGVTFYVYQAVGAEKGDFVLAVSERNISISQPYHSHVLKSSFGLLASYLPLGTRLSFENGSDFGYAYAKLLPIFIPIVGIIILLTLVSLAFLAIKELVKSGEKSGVIFIATLAITVLVKSVFDGGFLSHEVAPALVVLWLLFFAEKENISRKELVIPVTISVLPLLVGVTGFAFGLGGMVGISEYLVRSYGLLLLYIGLFALASRKTHKTLPIFMVILGVISMISVVTPVFKVASYEKRQIQDTRLLVGTYGSIGEFGQGMPPIERIGNLSFYSFSTTTSKTIGDVLNISLDASNYGPIRVYPKSCEAPHNFGHLSFIVASKKDLSLDARMHSLIVAHKIEKISGAGDFKRYKIFLSMAPCAPRRMNMLSEFIKELGADDFFIISEVEGSDLSY